ncbi:MAG: hypothetical protein Tsb0019_35280 [Roseibium sp.]
MTTKTPDLKKYNRVAVALLFLVLCGFWLAAGARADTSRHLVLSGFEAPGMIDVALKRLRAAYKTLGIEVAVKVTTPSRALVDSSSGRTDGEVVRADVIEEHYPSLMRVEVPLFTISTYAYGTLPELADKPVQDLKSLRAGYVRGAVFAEQTTRDYAETWQADSLDQLFAMLLQDRIDLAIAIERPARAMIEKSDLEGQVFAIRSSRRDYDFFHYLHEKKADLVPRIEKVLKRQSRGWVSRQPS